jgi:predicted nucleic acid-binding protein
MTVPVVTIDASAAVRWILDDEGDRDGALRLRRALEEGSVAAVEPTHFLIEVAAALDRAARDGRVEVDDARQALVALEAVSFNDASPMAVADEALGIAVRTGLRVQDGAYVVCANRHDARLVTADERQLEVARRGGVPAVALADLPPL